MSTMDSKAPSAGPAAPPLSARRLAVWRALVDTMEEPTRRLTANLQQVGLSAGDYLVMLALSQAAEHRLRSSEVADAIGWQCSRLSHHLGHGAPGTRPPR